jgi:DNA-binding beta-propeller fold protein YncE
MSVSTPIRKGVAMSTMAAVLTVAAGCGSEQQPQQQQSQQVAPTPPPSGEPVVVTYDGGLYVLDGRTLEVEADLKLPGFNRVNPAGDNRHVMVSTSNGFQVLDAVDPELTATEFPGPKPGHVVRHAGRTVLFSDGTGEVTILDSESLGEGRPETETYQAAEAHHGVAVELSNDELVVTLGNEEERTGMIVLDENRDEIARSEECPGVHGEATAKDEAVVIGCENGVLVYAGGEITKVESPAEYGRIGNLAGSEVSPIVLGDYKQDEDAELERPTQVSLIDTVEGSMKLVDIETSYTFRSLARGPQGEALVLGTDGRIHVIDPVRAEVVRTIGVLDESWEEPLEWQRPRPAIFVRGGTAYVSDPADKLLHRVDLASGTIEVSAQLPQAPNELTGVVAGH